MHGYPKRDPPYGRQVIWMDKEYLVAYYKDVYTHAGEFWKFDIIIGTYYYSEEYDIIIRITDSCNMVDVQHDHATGYQATIMTKGRHDRFRNPPEFISRADFTIAAIIQMSK